MSEPIKKLVAQVFTSTREETVTFPIGHKSFRLIDPETNKTYDPKEGWTVVGEDLAALFLESSPMQQNKEPSPDLNILFVQAEQCSDQYRFSLMQLAPNSWQARFERMDTAALLGDVSAKAETPAKAIELALILVQPQTETEGD